MHPDSTVPLRTNLVTLGHGLRAWARYLVAQADAMQPADGSALSSAQRIQQSAMRFISGSLNLASAEALRAAGGQ